MSTAKTIAREDPEGLHGLVTLLGRGNPSASSTALLACDLVARGEHGSKIIITWFELWLPIRIGWAHGGNHSITAGIVYGTGSVQPEACFDISPVYRHVHCDGLTYSRAHDRTVIAPVADIELAAIFEIGRLMTANRPKKRSANL